MSKLLDPDEMPQWIARLCPAGKRRPTILAGVNDDDCAVLKWEGRYIVITTDFLNANPIALELGIGDMWNLGRLLVASNLSDLCGSGATPICLLVGVTLPHGSTEAEFKKLMRGVKFEADRHGVRVVGGDTKLGKSRALMAVAIGSAQSPQQLFLKNGAKPGDVIWASGCLGSTAAAAWGYRRTDLDRRWKTWARKSLLIPHLPLAVSAKISASHLGNGGTDVSDGLGANILALCNASSTGAIIDAGKIPIAAEVRQAARVAGTAQWNFAFASGGDFQFLVTTGRAARNKMMRYGLCEIGEITKDRRLQLRLPSGKLVPLPTEGHRDHRRLAFADEVDNLIGLN